MISTYSLTCILVAGRVSHLFRSPNSVSKYTYWAIPGPNLSTIKAFGEGYAGVCSVQPPKDRIRSVGRGISVEDRSPGYHPQGKVEERRPPLLLSRHLVIAHILAPSQRSHI